MRWDALFDDLEARLAELERSELRAEVAEHTRAELGQVPLDHRYQGAIGHQLQWLLSGLGPVTARLAGVGDGWLLLQTDLDTSTAPGRELLIPSTAVRAAGGLPLRSNDQGEGASRRFGLRQALRAIARDRAAVRVHDREGEHATGTIDRVLADHFDLARHADDIARRSEAVRGVLTIPYAALAAVQRL